MQDAFEKALARWPREAFRPAGAWIVRTAHNAAIDRSGASRCSAASARCSPGWRRRRCPTTRNPLPDERLGLIFACCHPALAADAAVPLTLRMLGA